MCKEFLCNKEQCKFKCNYCVLRETWDHKNSIKIIHFILSIHNFSKNFSLFFGKCAKFVQNFALFCRKGAKSVQKFCAVLRAKHKTLLVLRVFCAISNGSALFCFAQNAQKQRKTAHFAQIRKEMHIPACKGCDQYFVFREQAFVRLIDEGKRNYEEASKIYGSQGSNNSQPVYSK